MVVQKSDCMECPREDIDSTSDVHAAKL